MNRPALKLIDTSYQVKEGTFWSAQSDFHSLHNTLQLPAQGSPQSAFYFLSKYSAKDSLVLDPFCGSGAVVLQANLMGRLTIASDASSFHVKVTRAKTQPSNITDVALTLQRVNLKRPIDLGSFNEHFAPFYDLNTFRELVNLRGYLLANDTEAARFIELSALSLLHGHSAGYFSVYTFPQISLQAREQRNLNDKRRQIPDYRPLIPRILRKTASVLRDSVPSILEFSAEKSRVLISDPRDLSHVPSGSVDLVLTNLPALNPIFSAKDIWLKLWFSGLNESALPSLSFEGSESWREYINEALLEMARTTRTGGRVVLLLPDQLTEEKSFSAADEVLNLVEENLRRYLDPEASFINVDESIHLKNGPRQKGVKSAKRSRALVLRRR